MAQRKKRPEVHLDRALEFLRALWAFDHALERTSKRMQARLGITAEQRMILRIVGRNPSISSGQLATMLHLDAGTISAALRRLEEKSLVVRRKNSPDGRRVSVDLTRKGKQFDHPTEGTVESAVESVLKQVGPTEVRAMHRLLGRLVAALDESHRAL
jgi:MarR family transcriptional regulator, organic hydroperoxide resistance regulator